MVAAETARTTAEHHPALNADAAYVMALMHDIGRSTGGPDVADVRHVLDGYRSMLERGFDDSARICLTHSFPIKQADAFAGRWDCPGEEKQFVQSYLDRTEYTPYDRLVQLCDALALPSGPVLMEKRLVDVALRSGFNDFTCQVAGRSLAAAKRTTACFGKSTVFERLKSWQAPTRAARSDLCE